MDDYNKSRHMAGFPVEYELGVSIAEYTEKRGKQILERNKSLLVNLICVGPDGKRVGRGNGVFYLGGGQKPLVLTCGHLIGLGGAVGYLAQFYTEAGEFCDKLPLKQVKPDPSPSSGQQLAAPQAPQVDLAVFEIVLPTGINDMPMLAPPLPPAPPAIGDKTYIMACTEHSFSFTEGMVSSMGLDVYHTTAYADDGYSGAPVISSRGFLFGLVVSGIGSTIKQVAFIPVNAIQIFLVNGSPQLPGLPAI